ncbi:nuclease-related domain-containing DEAD/DEAH box helicase [Demequina aestuarii]|uniref:nuclease-related domain-containing DEAD/DEAH box helicase n=1 Tax=Demequina aestuarii TaxID=327095 RepID=UPI000B319FE3|nr:NERD domain-containing protein/DEAD/DEAH box helicase [Demequina aestuarii]
MARMIPPVRPLGVAPGELSLFDALSSSSGADGWAVLHSLDIANHVSQVEGEADFVVVVPGGGILCIEVKSHLNVERSPDGIWKLGGDPPTARSPFKQAHDEMYSLRGYLKKHTTLRSIPMLCAVWFTGAPARRTLDDSPEWHSWQVLDSKDLADAVSAIQRTLAAGIAHLEATSRAFSGGAKGPTNEEVDRVVRALRPRFELAMSPGDRRRARETQLSGFVEEQFSALDAMVDNRQVLFTGAAGTGKTFLALEAARRESLEGRQGRLLCFNSLLAAQLAGDAKGLAGLTVRTIHQDLLSLAGMRAAPKGADSAFWREELPMLALEGLVSRGDAAVQDFAVIDEVQDIAVEPYLDVLDLMVSGGLAEGRLLLFGDFERQSIFENQAGRELLSERLPRLATFRLTVNCRNLPRIGYGVNSLTELQPGYADFRRLDDHVEPMIVRYGLAQDQEARLVDAVRNLRDEGFALHEIVVLSPLRANSAAAKTSNVWLRQNLEPMSSEGVRPGRLLYTTIQAFKGLDAPAVIVTDLCDANLPNFESLMYVGLTRATDRLVAFFEAETLKRALGGGA